MSWSHAPCLVLAAFVIIAVVQIDAKLSLKNIGTANDVKEFKKILRTKTNVLVIFSKDDKSAVNSVKWLEGVAKELKGKGTFVQISCGDSKDTKKLCKKFNVSPSPVVMKHYKDGSFNKDYDRKHVAKSMYGFMLDPTGDIPWDEDVTAKDVVHVNSEKELNRLRAKHKHPMLVMFYAPWCGHCKRLKPEYSVAATELKKQAVMAAMDLDKPDTQSVKMEFNVTGFPTIVFFKEGKPLFNYGGDYNKDGLVKWMKDPQPPKEPEPEVEWKDQPSDVLHLTDSTFDEALATHKSVLVMFYAPWCGHCKSMKPEYVKAATKLKEENIDGVLAAVDCTKETKLGSRFGVEGYPTVKYFGDGQEQFKVSLRKEQEIIDFMKDPSEPPPPPPEDKPWQDTSNDRVLHLTDDNFKKEIKKKKHVFVMFYAPWCGHCKNAKPEIEQASLEFDASQKVFFAGVDCTVHRSTCDSFDVTGFPTFYYFKYGKDSFKYTGGRKKADFVSFMNDPKEGPPPPPPEPEWKDTPSDVHHLTDASFDDFMKEHDSVLVMFYAPWCGHCKRMKPDYQAAAEVLTNKKSSGKLAAVDCTKEKAIASKFSISGYPTVKYFQNGQDKQEYDQPRDKESIVKFMAKEAASPNVDESESDWSKADMAIDFLTDSTFDDYIAKHKSVLVLFYAPWCGFCKQMKPDYAEVGAIVNEHQLVPGRIAAVDATRYLDLASRFDIKGYPTLKYFKNGIEGKSYNEGLAKQDIIEFMKKADKDDSSDAVPETVASNEDDWTKDSTDVHFLTNDNFKEFAKDKKEILVMFYSPYCGHCLSLKPNFFKAAEVLNTQTPHVTLAAVDCQKETTLAQEFNIKGYPTMILFSNGVVVMEYDEGREAHDLVSFMQRTDKVKQRNADIDRARWQDLPSLVAHLTPANHFWQLDPFKHSLIMYHRFDCEACLPARANFMRAASRLKKSREFGFSAVDCGDHPDLCDQENITSFPTVKHYKRAVGTDSYPGGMEVDDFVNFLTARKKDEL